MAWGRGVGWGRNEAGSQFWLDRESTALVAESPHSFCNQSWSTLTSSEAWGLGDLPGGLPDQTMATLGFSKDKNNCSELIHLLTLFNFGFLVILFLKNSD